MKNLIVIRHAKSSWDQPELPDMDRPLNERGLRDAPFMGSLLKFRGLLPDRILSSPARRAVETARFIAREIGYPPEEIELRGPIYLADAPMLLDLLREFDDTWNRVFLIGHNPGLTDFVNFLADEDLSNVPTAGIASIRADVESWSHVSRGVGRLEFFDYPKRHR
jgi:phosphohistidine phosphatase